MSWGVVITIIAVLVIVFVFIPQCGEEQEPYSLENSDNSEDIVDNAGNSGYNNDHVDDAEGDDDGGSQVVECTEHTPNEDCICTKCGETAHVLNDKCTCTNCGKTFHTQGMDCLCTTCGSAFHNPNDAGYCKRCGYKRDGDVVYFGSYPQARVTETDLLISLSTAAGDIPTAQDAKNWTSYGYYKNGSNAVDYMWYQDVTLGSDKYRGVYFTEYRPYETTSPTGEYNGYQNENGYLDSAVYWFSYAPIEWTILSESDGNAMILCNMVLDGREYTASAASDEYEHNGGTGYANDYALSDIRKWLNDEFYNTAFAAMQKKLILSTTVDNSERSTNTYTHAQAWNGGENAYASENTEDNIFLLSEQEVTNGDYATLRVKKGTAYAQAQGTWTDGNERACWWLRSPVHSDAKSAHYVEASGNATSGSYYVYSSSFGIVPAMCMKVA